MVLSKTKMTRKIKIKEAYHYYQFITYVLDRKGTFVYPNSSYGDLFSRREILNAWKKTISLIKSGNVPKKFNIYVNIPFCQCCCFYCMSFSLKLKRTEEVLHNYLKLLYEEMDAFSSVLKNVQVGVVYLGGGTPSLLTEEMIKELFGNLSKKFRINEQTKIIFEASPFTLNHKKLDLLKSINISELDFGIQSFDQEVLNKNRRPQNVEKTIEIINYAKKIGIPSITFDIMLGMPYQSVESALNSIKKAISLCPDGIYINEFLPLKYTDFCLENNVYSEQDILLRETAAKQADEILRNAGYFHFPSDQGYRKSPEPDERSYLTQEAANILGLGFGSFSHACGSLKYEMIYSFKEFFEKVGGMRYFFLDMEKKLRILLNENKKLEKLYKNSKLGKRSGKQYIGLKLNLNEEMCNFAYSKFENISFKEFKKIFKKEFREVFKEQLFVLKSLGLVRIKKDGFVFSAENIAEKKVIRTFFMDKDYIYNVLKSSNERYDPKKDYLPLIRKTSTLLSTIR